MRIAEYERIPYGWPERIHRLEESRDADGDRQDDPDVDLDVVLRCEPHEARCGEVGIRGAKRPEDVEGEGHRSGRYTRTHLARKSESWPPRRAAGTRGDAQTRLHQRRPHGERARPKHPRDRRRRLRTGAVRGPLAVRRGLAAHGAGRAPGCRGCWVGG